MAYLLSTTAGIVNVASLIAFYVLTTNITGHMAILSEEIAKMHWYQVQVVVIWFFMFFAGAFTSTIIVTTYGYSRPRVYNSIAVFIEVVILVGVGFYGLYYYEGRLRETEVLAAALLFAMGLQNALITTISNYVVRTTHLTGLLTDIGIDVALLFNRRIKDKTELKKKLHLRFTIMLFYFIGGLVGAVLYLRIEFQVFYLAAAILLVALYYDFMRVSVYKIKKRIFKLFGISKSGGSLKNTDVLEK
ncbi:MAG: YoaK family protein [Cytophagaceae bacterium]